MNVQVMTKDECLKVLSESRLAKLACCHENQPYVVPVYLAYDSSRGQPCFYGFTTPGQKVEWMRANPLVCVEVDEVQSLDQWVSVVVFGRYEELLSSCTNTEPNARVPSRSSSIDSGTTVPISSAGEEKRLFAYEILQSHAAWWEPAAATRAKNATGRQFVPIFYTIHIDKVTGHLATNDSESL